MMRMIPGSARSICPACREVLTTEQTIDITEYKRHIINCVDVKIMSLERTIQSLKDKLAHYEPKERTVEDIRREWVAVDISGDIKDTTPIQVPLGDLVIIFRHIDKHKECRGH